MPDQALKILKETLPTRCEICHQADQFDPVTGNCRRCQSVFGGIPGLATEATGSCLVCPRCGSWGKFFPNVGFCYQCYEQTATPVGQAVRYGPVAPRSGSLPPPQKISKADAKPIQDRSITLNPPLKKLAIAMYCLVLIGAIFGLVKPVLLWFGFILLMVNLSSWDRSNRNQ